MGGTLRLYLRCAAACPRARRWRRPVRTWKRPCRCTWSIFWKPASRFRPPWPPPPAPHASMCGARASVQKSPLCSDACRCENAGRRGASARACKGVLIRTWTLRMPMPSTWNGRRAALPIVSSAEACWHRKDHAQHPHSTSAWLQMNDGAPDAVQGRSACRSASWPAFARFLDGPMHAGARAACRDAWQCGHGRVGHATEL